MPKWPRGERTVQYLIDKGRLERVGADALPAMANLLLERAARRIATARAGLELDDFDGAYAAAYDAYRMAAESLLIRQGLRATGGEGSHMTVEDAVSAQFAADIPAFAKPTFERIRRTRHTAQYFDPSAAPITAADAQWALDRAGAAVAGAAALFTGPPPGSFS